MPSIAAITYADGCHVDELLADFSRSLIAKGWRVRGLVQEMHAVDNVCEIILVDLDGNTAYPITQDLGACSTACRLDPAAMTEAGAVLRRISRADTDLAVFNRFGKQEADGTGFTAEMLDLMSQGIPVLTIVSDKYLDAWRHFTGGLSVELAAERGVLESWFSSLALPLRSSSDTA